jgi:hypothetical protein
MNCRGKYLLFPFFLSLISVISAPPAKAESSERVIVATRNIYLGSDVGIAMKKLPNFPAAAQFMWDQVAATDFSQRAPLLAQELLSSGASVIGIQEATRWKCRAGIFSKEVVVHDFLSDLLSAIREKGGNFTVAEFDNRQALNPGFEISPIPLVTLVRDEKLFPSLFGKERVACGFTISDALLVRDDVEVLDAGTSEYSATYSIIPTLMTIYRGYAWADLKVGESVFRAITTHLESLWDANMIPNAALQADQLISDLASAKMPVIVMGDFNSDPRDPRPSDQLDVNPGAQPSASEKCRAQVGQPTEESALDTCNAYWKLIRAGFTELSPDAQDPKNFSWGADALLSGPAADRVQPSLDMGGNGIFTDRLDYIFLKNGRSAINGAVFGNQWPEGLDTWRCSSVDQVGMTARGVQALEKVRNISGGKFPNEGRCLPSDHAGIAGAADIAHGEFRDSRLPERARSPFTFWRVTGGALLLAIGALVSWRIRRVRRSVGVSRGRE